MEANTENKTPGLIYAAMVGVMNDCTAITKDRTHDGAGNFKFRGIDDVMNSLHDILAKNKIFLSFKDLNLIQSDRVTSKGKDTIHTLLEVEYKFTTIDESFVTYIATGEAMNNMDKGVNKARSIALKYVCLQAFMIPTKEDKDPDADSHEPTRRKPRTQSKAPAMITKAQLGNIARLCGSEEARVALKGKLGVKSMKELSKDDASTTIKQLESEQGAEVDIDQDHPFTDDGPVSHAALDKEIEENDQFPGDDDPPNGMFAEDDAFKGND